MRYLPDRSVPPVKGFHGKFPILRLSVPAAACLFVAAIHFSAVIPRAAALEAKPDKIRVEVFLAKGHKKESEAIEKGFGEVSVRHVQFQYFRAGRPPANIAIGRDVPATVARQAIRIAGDEAEGIDFIVPEALLPASWIGIGTSAFDEKNLIPISPENLKRLSDPKLSSEAFHALYNEFAKIPKIY